MQDTLRDNMEACQASFSRWRNFLREEGLAASRRSTMAGVNWYNVRKELRRLRVDYGMNASELARRTGLHRKRVARFEDLKDLAYTPDMDIIQAYLVTLGRHESALDFLKQFADVNSPVIGSRDTVPVPPQEGIATDADSTTRVSLVLPRLTADEARLLQRLGLILLGTAHAALAQTEDGQATEAEPASGLRSLGKR